MGDHLNPGSCAEHAGNLVLAPKGQYTNILCVTSQMEKHWYSVTVVLVVLVYDTEGGSERCSDNPETSDGRETEFD